MRDSSLIVRLACLLAVLVGVQAYLRYRGEGEAAMLRRPTLVSSGTSVASVLRIARFGHPEVVLAREGNWRITNPFRSIADEASVLRAVDALCYQPILDSKEPSELQRLGIGLSDFGFGPASLSATVGFGGKTETIRFGGLTPSGEGVYATVSGIDSLFVVSTGVVAAVNVPVEAFRPRELMTVGPADVVSLDIRRGQEGRILLSRRDGIWNMVEPQEAHAAAGRVSAILRSFASARADSFVWPRGGTNETAVATSSLLAGYGLDDEGSISIVFGRVDGKSTRIVLGGDAGNGRVYALFQDGMSVATFPAELREVLSGASADFADKRLFPGDISSVRHLSIADGSLRCLISRGDDGSWQLDAPVSAVADSRAVVSVLTRLSTLVAADVVEEGVSVSLGTNSPAVMVSRSAFYADLVPEDFRSRDVLAVNPLGVRRISVFAAGEAKPQSIVFDGERRGWNIESASDETLDVDAGAVANLLEALNPLRAERVVCLSPAADELRRFGLDSPRMILAIDVEGERAVRRNILIGGEATNGGFFVTVGSSDSVFLVNEETIGKLSARIMIPANSAE